MRSDVHLAVVLTGADADEVLETLADLAPEGRFHRGRFELAFKKGDPALDELRATLDFRGIAYRLEEVRSFRPRELAEAVALRVAPGPRLPHADPGPATAAPFSGGCPDCGRGGEQVSDLVVAKEPPTGTGFALTEAGHLLVGEILARAMIERRISGCLLRSTRAEDGSFHPLFQLVPLSTLPPLCCPPTKLEASGDVVCRGCGTGALRVSSLLYYDLAEDALSDINVCHEAEGLLGGVAAGVVVSQRFFRLLCEVDAPFASAEPIVLV